MARFPSTGIRGAARRNGHPAWSKGATGTRSVGQKVRGDASQTLLTARRSANARNNHTVLSKLLEADTQFGRCGKH